MPEKKTKDPGSCDPTFFQLCVEGVLSGGRLYKEKVEGEKLPAADVGGGGEEGEDEDDGVEEVPAVHHKLCLALQCIITFASIILI